ncbi:MAG: (d)CMP kinase, partial [Nitrospirae bacterium]|nr:(d)CMP kinase [Nitrospirota bacterium]
MASRKDGVCTLGPIIHNPNISSRDCARGKEVVTEGRDTTTVIFPKAWRKFYVTASTEVRIRRRFKQLRDYHLDVDIRQAEMDVVKRDRRDSERELSPLAKAVDALVIDTSDKSIEESLEEILGLL